RDRRGPARQAEPPGRADPSGERHGRGPGRRLSRIVSTATKDPVSTTPPVRRAGGVRRLSRSEHAVGWAFVTPATLIIAVFGMLPILWSLLLSFQQSDLLTPETPWVGLDNYRQIRDDATFRLAMEHTLVYTVLFVPATMIVGLFIAVALNR